jgi:glycine cleavage system H protein
MLVPDDLRYSQDHQWVRVEGDVLRVGITEFAQEALGEVTMVRIQGASSSDSPQANAPCAISAGAEMGEIEANSALHDSPTAVNRDPYGDGWLCTVRPSAASDVDNLLNAEAYRELIGYTDG